MYHHFYGLSEPPFNLTPNPKYFFESPKHLEALSTLLYAINQRKGFVVVTGDVGAGKTTVCRSLLNHLETRTKTALITNTYLSAKDLLMSILDDFEVDYVPGSKSKLHYQLNEYLIEQLRLDNNVVLIVDEAQNLTFSLFEEIRMLSNLETEFEKLIQIIFLGQPELRQKLADPRLDQLRQRVSVYYHLTPLDCDDTKKYVSHRLAVAGFQKDVSEIFPDDVLKRIHEFTRGVPRLVNQICDSALLTGFIREKFQVDMDMLEEVIRESPMTQLGQTSVQNNVSDNNRT